MSQEQSNHGIQWFHDSQSNHQNDCKERKKKIGKKRQTHKQQQQQQQNPTKNTNYGIIKTTAWDGGKVEMTCHSLAIFPHECFIDDCS